MLLFIEKSKCIRKSVHCNQSNLLFCHLNLSILSFLTQSKMNIVQNLFSNFTSYSLKKLKFQVNSNGLLSNALESFRNLHRRRSCYHLFNFPTYLCSNIRVTKMESTTLSSTSSLKSGLQIQTKTIKVDTEIQLEPNYRIFHQKISK